MRDRQALPRWAWCGLLMASLTCLLLVPAGARAATVLGSLTLTPASGLASSPISMSTVSTGTAKGCPAPSTNIVGYITGPGAWSGGFLAVTNTDTGISLTSDFEVQLSDTVGGIAQSNGVTITPGKYTITVYCANDLGTTRYGEFSSPVWFTDATRYQTTDPAGPAPSPTSPAPTTPAPTPGPSVSTPAPAPGGNPVVTTTTLTASPAGSSAQGAPITLTATLAPVTAAGSVTFRDGSGSAATVLGTSLVTNGIATIAAGGLSAGSHVLSATFVPAVPANFGPSQSGTMAYTITATAGPGTLGTLLLDPSTGLASSPVSMSTVSSGAAKGCPAPSTNIVGYITGPGAWAAGVLAVTNTDTGISLTSDFGVQLSDTFGGIAQSNGLTIEPGKYTITVYCANDLGAIRYGEFSAPVWFTDATHFQSNDPASSQTPTQTVLTTSPQDRTDVGQKVTLTATITPASATGNVQFRTSQNGTFAPVGDPVKVSGGTAAISSTTLGFALYQFSAVFTPAEAAKLTASTSPEVVFVVARPIPPVPKARAAVTGKVTVNQTVTCSSSFANAKSISYQWIRDRDTIVGGTGKSYRLVAADGAHAIRCRALATNDGGTTSRTSRAIRVAR